MTSLIGDAFGALYLQGTRARGPKGVNSVVVLVVDEADALAQSREAQQMHHEDRAGVDALLAGIDSLAGARVPVLVVLCTNRVGALDPAVMRRAAAIFTFTRPDDEQRHAVLTAGARRARHRPETVDKVVELTGPTASRPGYTFSDLTQRLVPPLSRRLPRPTRHRRSACGPCCRHSSRPRCSPRRLRWPRSRPGPHAACGSPGTMYQWLVVWRAASRPFATGPARAANPVIAVGVEVDGVGNLDDVVLYRSTPPHTYTQVKYAVDSASPINEAYLSRIRQGQRPVDPPQDRRLLAAAHRG